ncbi:hypothetical protein ACHAW5_002976 [Stephanodiscus triporus]|uniref:Cleavage and polyadenylation specificity factor subunit 2 n=1 Tax=Stephanodiscus triporus TaxID=2934178 RepID=A0ABD3PF94_9STRA
MTRPSSLVVAVVLPPLLVVARVATLRGIVRPVVDSLSLVPPRIVSAPPRINGRARAAVSSSADATTTTTSTSSSGGGRAPFGFRYTHLEGNGQLWQITTDGPKRGGGDDDYDDGGDGRSSSSGSSSSLSVVVDPLASQLDFGMPWGYRANKRIMSEDETIDAICDANPSHCLLTMGLDDHTHLPTLSRLRDRMPDMKYVVAPSCVGKLTEMGIRSECVTVLDHGRSCDLLPNDDYDDDDGGIGGGFGAIVTATRGALVGPPWQRRENGYLLELFRYDNDDDGGTGDRRHGREGGASIYYEPHGDVVLDDIRDARADVVISPVTRQSLPAHAPPIARYTLVHGGERTLRIAETLRASVIVPLGNGALDVEGPLSGLVISSGDVDDFEDIVTRRNIDATNNNMGGGGGEGADDVIIMKVARAIPGVPLTIMI